jgi:hypothetical protein
MSDVRKEGRNPFHRPHTPDSTDSDSRAKKRGAREPLDRPLNALRIAPCEASRVTNGLPFAMRISISGAQMAWHCPDCRCFGEQG